MMAFIQIKTPPYVSKAAFKKEYLKNTYQTIFFRLSP